MGLLAMLAVRRVHLLVVAAVGYELLGARAEAAARRRGWQIVWTPEEADALVVCGGITGPLAGAVDSLWRAVPSPHVRRRLLDRAAIEQVLDSIVRVLADDELQGASASGSPEAPEPAEEPTSCATGMRRVALGPLLPDWPVGLVVEGEAHRGVVLSVEGRFLGDVEPPESDPSDPATAAFVLLCGRAQRVLRLAGWPATARRLAALGDAALSEAPPASLHAAVEAVAVRTRRSAILRGNLARVGSDVDVRARLLRLLADAARAASGDAPPRQQLDAAGSAAVLLGRRLVDAPMLMVVAEVDEADA